MVLSSGESMLQVDASLLATNTVHVHQVWTYVVDHGIKSDTIFPALAKIFDFQPIFSEKKEEQMFT